MESGIENVKSTAGKREKFAAVECDFDEDWEEWWSGSRLLELEQNSLGRQKMENETGQCEEKVGGRCGKETQ